MEVLAHLATAAMSACVSCVGCITRTTHTECIPPIERNRLGPDLYDRIAFLDGLFCFFASAAVFLRVVVLCVLLLLLLYEALLECIASLIAP